MIILSPQPPMNMSSSSWRIVSLARPARNATAEFGGFLQDHHQREGSLFTYVSKFQTSLLRSRGG